MLEGYDQYMDDSDKKSDQDIGNNKAKARDTKSQIFHIMLMKVPM